MKPNKTYPPINREHYYRTVDDEKKLEEFKAGLKARSRGWDPQPDDVVLISGNRVLTRANDTRFLQATMSRAFARLRDKRATREVPVAARSSAPASSDRPRTSRFNLCADTPNLGVFFFLQISPAVENPEG